MNFVRGNLSAVLHECFSFLTIVFFYCNLALFFIFFRAIEFFVEESGKSYYVQEKGPIKMNKIKEANGM